MTDEPRTPNFAHDEARTPEHQAVVDAISKVSDPDALRAIRTHVDLKLFALGGPEQFAMFKQVIGILHTSEAAIAKAKRP